MSEPQPVIISGPTYTGLKAVFVKDIGWKEVGHDMVEAIRQNDINGFVTIDYKDGTKVRWLVNPRWIIVTVRP